jgi:hypothetical protein
MSWFELAHACKPALDVGFDFTITAGLHSQLSGVLAAFAFAALTFALQPLQASADQKVLNENKSSLAHAVTTLLCSFLALVVTTFLFSILAGEDGATASTRSAAEEALSSAAFAISALMLLYAVIGLVESSGLSETAREVRAVVVLGVPVFAMLLVGLAISDAAHANSVAARGGAGACAAVAVESRISFAATVLLPSFVFVLTGLMVAAKYTTFTRPWVANIKVTTPGSSGVRRNLFPKASLFVVLLLGGWSAWIGEQVQGFQLLSATLWVLLIFYALFLLWQTVILLFSTPGEQLELGAAAPTPESSTATLAGAGP